MIALAIFIICTGILVYVFFVYPVGVLILGSAKKLQITPRWSEPPTVTMVLSAHNEEDSIANKLQNTLSQDYPADKLDIVTVDDGSTDRTAAIIEEFDSDRITLIRQDVKSGKTAALNKAVERATGEVLIFTDANAMYQPDAIRQLISLFDQEGKVGVVCGELNYRPHPEAVSNEESRYWNLEIRLKKAEGNLGTLLGANGSIYAMRRDLYQPLSEDMISDFIGPLLIAQQGYKTVYQPRAVSVETSTRSLQSEFRRKKRIVHRGLYALRVHSSLLNPVVSGSLAVQLWSHKVLRWLTPVWLAGILIGSWWLAYLPFFKYLYIIQLCCYCIGVIGLMAESGGRQHQVLRLPAYILMNLGAALVGLWGVLRGRKVVTWEPQR